MYNRLMERIMLVGLLMMLLVSQITLGFWHGRSGFLEDGCPITRNLDQLETTTRESHLHIDSCPTTNAVALFANHIGLFILFIAFLGAVPQNFTAEFSFPPATPPPRPV